VGLVFGPVEPVWALVWVLGVFAQPELGALFSHDPLPDIHQQYLEAWDSKL